MMAQITRGTILREMQQIAWHNVLCCSKNLLMNEPKEGMEGLWAEVNAKAEIIDQMVAELPARYYDERTACARCHRQFVGTISGHAGVGQRIDRVDVEIAGTREGAGHDVRSFGVGSALVTSFLNSGRYDEERHARYDEGKAATVTVVVDDQNNIQGIEWREDK